LPAALVFLPEPTVVIVGLKPEDVVSTSKSAGGRPGDLQRYLLPGAGNRGDKRVLLALYGCPVARIGSPRAVLPQRDDKA
jgi:hypothetical protein